MMLSLARRLDSALDAVCLWWLARRGPVIANVTIRSDGFDECIYIGDTRRVGNVWADGQKPFHMVNVDIIAQ